MKVIGMLSGTSVDGLDVAVADLDVEADVVTLRPLHATTEPLPAGIRAAALGVLPPAQTTAGALCRLDTEFGQFCGAVAADVARTHGGDLVATLGQTVFHWVEDGVARGTLQVGQPAWIAEATGLPVVSDLRARDVAAGGHGAPLASTLDALWLRGRERRVALNLGGIANLTVVGTVDDPVLAYDSGPANCLLDVVATRAGIAEGYDVDGRLSSRGRVDDELLADMLTEPYFAQRPPKSTGRELFTPAWLDGHVAGRGIDGRGIDDADLAATLVELTARTVADAIGRHGVDEVIASGGGVRNPVLADRLAALLRPVSMRSSDDLGLPADAKEAYLVALLGWLTWHGVPGVVPGATGSTRPRVLGRITPGDDPLRLPEPVPWIRALEIR
ncbi:MAG: anhydro-N-acetylmuramic acid kinase [Mycobacterium sp.]